MDARHAEAGVTLVELVIALAIAVITLALGAPTLARLKAQVQVRTVQGQITHALQHARHAAIMRSTRVMLCPSSDGQHCRSGFAWHAGWLIALDADHDGKPDPAVPPLATAPLVPAGVRVITSVGRERIVFHPDGSAPGSNASFTICHGAQAAGAAVTVSNVGRTRNGPADPERVRQCLATAQ